jgi:hypothetical protein
MSFWAQIPNRATSPIIDDTLTVSLITRRPRIAPASVVGTLMRTRKDCHTEPKDEKRTTKATRATTVMKRPSWCSARCWPSNCPPKVT